jgi:hypothetical protein
MAGAVDPMKSTPARTMTPKKTLFTVSRSWSRTSAANTPREARAEKSSRARGRAGATPRASGSSSSGRVAGALEVEKENRR